jgi:hypothetical protein
MEIVENDGMVVYLLYLSIENTKYGEVSRIFTAWRQKKKEMVMQEREYRRAIILEKKKNRKENIKFNEARKAWKKIRKKRMLIVIKKPGKKPICYRKL